MPARPSSSRPLALFLLAATSPLLAQVNTGELRLKITDPAGLGVKASVTVSSGASQYSNAFTTTGAGEVDIKTLPYGIYLVRAQRPGFTPSNEALEVRSALPAVHTIQLTLAPVSTSVQVKLRAPHRPLSPVLHHADRRAADSGPRRLAARPLRAGPGQLPARLAL